MTPRADLAALLEEALDDLVDRIGGHITATLTVGRVAAALREREPAERDDRDERIDDLTARLAQANAHLAELGFVLADAPAERAEPPDSLPPLPGIAAFVQKVLRAERGSREDYACRHCGQMMSAHDMSTLGSVFCPGELCGPPSPVTTEPPTIEVGDVVLGRFDSRWTVSSGLVTTVPEWALGIERAGTVIWRRQP